MGAQAFNPFNHMNSKFHDGVLPVPNSLGNFTYVKSSAEFAFTTGTGTQTDFFVLMWTPSSCAGFYIADSGSCSELQSGMLNHDKPAFIRPGRLGMRVMNGSRQDYVGGFVSVYQSPMPLNLNFTTATNGSVDAATITSLKDIMSDSARVTKMTGKQFADQPREFWVRPASAQQFPEWQTYHDITSSAADERSVMSFGLMHQGTSVVVLGFHDGSLGNQYRVQVQREDFCRYHGNTLGATVQRTPPPLQSHEGFAAASQGLPYS